MRERKGGSFNGSVGATGAWQLGVGSEGTSPSDSLIMGTHCDQVLCCKLSSLIFKSHKGAVKKAVFSSQLK